MGRLGCGEGELGGGCATAVDVVSAHPSPDATAVPGVPSVSVLELARCDTAFDTGRFIGPLALLHALA